MTARECVTAFVAALLLGGLFRVMRLPVPAPSVLAGVAGVAGLTIGYLLVERLLERL